MTLVFTFSVFCLLGNVMACLGLNFKLNLPFLLIFAKYDKLLMKLNILFISICVFFENFVLQKERKCLDTKKDYAKMLFRQHMMLTIHF